LRSHACRTALWEDMGCLLGVPSRRFRMHGK
jgi:hypothetical protein